MENKYTFVSIRVLRSEVDQLRQRLRDAGFIRGKYEKKLPDLGSRAGANQVELEEMLKMDLYLKKIMKKK